MVVAGMGIQWCMSLNMKFSVYIKDTKTVSEGTKYINIIIDVNLQT